MNLWRSPVLRVHYSMHTRDSNHALDSCKVHMLQAILSLAPCQHIEPRTIRELMPEESEATLAAVTHPTAQPLTGRAHFLLAQLRFAAEVRASNV